MRERENCAIDAYDYAAATTHVAGPVAPNVVVAPIVAARVAPTPKPQDKRSSHCIPCSFSSSSRFFTEDHTELKQQ